MKRLRVLIIVLAAAVAGVIPALALAASGPQPHASSTTTCSLTNLLNCLPLGSLTGTTTGTTTTAASGTPIVSTGTPATNVTPTTATLTGTVDLNGASLSTLSTTGNCYFEYGTTTSYGSTAACTPSPSASGSTTVSANLTGLTGGTAYHYQLVVVTGGLVLGVGATTTGGGDQTVTTPSTSVPPTAATTTATNVSGTSAIMTGTVNPENWTITSCTFTVASAGGTPQTAACTTPPTTGATSQAVSAPVIGLTEGTAYTYSLSVTYGASSTGTGTTSTTTTTAASGSGVTVTSTNNTTFTTTAATVTAPQALTASGATLAGTLNPEGQNVSTCTFYYGVSVTNLASTPCAQAAGAISGTSPVNVSATVTGLKAKTNYIDTVVMVTDQGTAVATAGSFTTLVTPTGTTAAATGVTATTATLHGTVNAGGEGVTACAFEWGVNPLTSSSSPSADLALVEQCTATPSANGDQSVTVTLKGLAPKTKYYDRVLLTTYGGYLIANTATFNTRASAAAPTLKITRSTINKKAHSAKFTFARTGSTVATKGFQCALVKVVKGRAGTPRYIGCKSAKSYTKLKAVTYQFDVRAGNASGFGKAASHRFTL